MKSGSTIFAALALLLSAPAYAAGTGCQLGIMADLPVTMEGYRASVPVKINGKDTRFWLDSGAFFSIMPKAKALELGLPLTDLPYGFYLVGVGGTASAELTTVKSLGIVGNELKNVQFLVGGSDAGNGLIGRNILGIADTEFDLANGSVKLVNAHNCAKSALAYWAPGKPFFTVPLKSDPNPRDHVFLFPISINGVEINAEFDTGAPTSLLSSRAAARAGIDLASPNAVPLTNISGIGRGFKKGWVVPIDNVSVGDEQILRTHLDVIDGPITAGADGPDMLVGADFILTHHIYVARSQHRIFFTYSGGRPFLTSLPAPEPAKAAPTALPSDTRRVEAVANAAAKTETAEEFARRGNFNLTQQAYAKAIADLSKAIELAPTSAAFYRDRARAYVENGQPELALADLDKAIAIAPEDGELRRIRAFGRFAANDKEGALADTEVAARLTAPASLETAKLAILFERLGRPDRAIALFDTVISAHREDSVLGQLLNGRCWVRGLAGVDLDKALDDCNRAIKRDGGKAAYLDSRGLINFRKGNFAAAVADYDAALKLDSKLAWSLYVRGLARTALGQGVAGKDDVAAAAAIKPDIADEALRYGIHP